MFSARCSLNGKVARASPIHPQGLRRHLLRLFSLLLLLLVLILLSLSPLHVFT